MPHLAGTTSAIRKLMMRLAGTTSAMRKKKMRLAGTTSAIRKKTMRLAEMIRESWEDPLPHLSVALFEKRNWNTPGSPRNCLIQDNRCRRHWKEFGERMVLTVFVGTSQHRMYH